VSGTPYTLTLTITPNAGGSTITATITGGSLNLSNSVIDTTGILVTNYDCFAIRPDNLTNSAALFTFTEFKVEKLGSGGGSQFNITGVSKPTADTSMVAWDSVSGQKYQIQSCDNLNQSGWITNATVTATSCVHHLHQFRRHRRAEAFLSRRQHTINLSSREQG